MALPTNRCQYCKKSFTVPESSAHISVCTKSICLTEAIVEYWNAHEVQAVVTNGDTGPQLAELWKGQIRIYPS
jgi:hypothetical protein